ncbi:Smr/MutS family protein [Sorangium sp. So ce185]|uniref:Smr/MutS family protein n=1 Tax=Sorangium sp. So ce185 TaxID=3133287 RepID=UPI003F6407EF
MAKGAKRERDPRATASPGRAAKAAAHKANEAFYQPFSTLRQLTKPKPKPAATPDAKAKAAATPDAKAKTAAAPEAKARAKAEPEAKARAKAEPEAKARAKASAGAAAQAGVEPAPRPVDPETFAIYMAGVRVLEDRVNRIPVTASRVERAALPTIASDPDEEARSRMRSLVIEGIKFETTDDSARIEGRRLDVDPRELRRLRRARYAVDGTLDLHGLRLEAAREAVEAFVCKRQRDGDRVVAIVHGKGNHSPGGHAVLRGEIAAWLSNGRVARHVAAFSTAPDAEGGAGAVLVLLAR